MKYKMKYKYKYKKKYKNDLAGGVKWKDCQLCKGEVDHSNKWPNWLKSPTQIGLLLVKYLEVLENIHFSEKNIFLSNILKC